MTANDRVNVLLVDDQPTHLLLLEAMLADMGAAVVSAASGEAALDAVAHTDFAVILLDVRMPAMDGFEAARRIRALPRSRLTPIIFVTADERASDVEAAYALGAVDVIAKPLGPAAVRGKVAFFIELFRSKLALTNERAFLSAVLASVEDGIVACDAEGVLTLFNRAAQRFHGMPARPLPPGEWAAQYGLRRADGQAPLPQHELPLVRALAGERLRGEKLVIAPQDGPPRTVVASGGPLLDEHGRKLGAVVSMHDHTAREEAQAAREFSRELQRLAQELSAADRRKNEFLATLAHELRNPLAPLRNGLQVMRLAAGNPAAVAKAQDMMERQLGHMVHLVNDLLDVARISSGKLELRRQRTPLKTVIGSAMETALPMIEKGRHELRLDMPDDELIVDADPTRLAQVVANLLDNAAKYTPAGGSIGLAVRRDGDAALVQVSDNGIGIDADALQQVFEMFVQGGDDATRVQSGLGIGLSLVRRLVELHGGTVTAASEGAGRGSMFTVRLPLAAHAADTGIAPATPAHDAAPGRLRVLVVDDNLDAAESFAMLLRLGGHEVALAGDGAQALRAVQAARPDVVFLDLGLPDGNGCDVARALRRLPHGQELLLVALTGWGTEDDRARSRDAGFDHHLTKPADPDVVERLLAEWLASGVAARVTPGADA